MTGTARWVTGVNTTVNFPNKKKQHVCGRLISKAQGKILARNAIGSGYGYPRNMLRAMVIELSLDDR